MLGDGVSLPLRTGGFNWPSDTAYTVPQAVSSGRGGLGMLIPAEFLMENPASGL